MMSYYYSTSLNGSTTKPLDIYRGMEKIGSVRGYYKNTLIKYMEEFFNDGRPYFLQYELCDSAENVRLHAKMSNFWKSEITVSYVDNNENNVEVLMKNMKDVRFGPKKIEFTFRGDDYTILKKESIKEALTLNPFPAEMYLGEKLIAEWKIEVFDKRVVVHIYDNDFIQDEYLILGLFHAFLYATKG